MTALEVRDVVAGYGRIEALHGISLRVDEGEAVTIIGSNGAGKTTLLKAIAGLVPLRHGTILLSGTDVSRWPPERRARSGVALAPEGRQVFPGLSVADNLRLGAYGRWTLGKRRRHARVVRTDIDRVTDLFPPLRERLAQPAGTLSGGEQQMLAVGRALLSRPHVLLLDEPSLGLAPLAVREVVVRLRQLIEARITLLLVEQNAAAAFAVAKRGYVLERGTVRTSGPVEELRRDRQVQQAYLGSPTFPSPAE